jgi:hypothetical protein
MLITRNSPVSGKIHTKDLNITQDQINDYENGGLIQQCFPNLDATEREFFKTGITAEEWEEIMKDCD